MSSNGPTNEYYGTLEVNLKTCVKGTKLRVYRPKLRFVVIYIEYWNVVDFVLVEC